MLLSRIGLALALVLAPTSEVRAGGADRAADASTSESRGERADAAPAAASQPPAATPTPTPNSEVRARGADRAADASTTESRGDRADPAPAAASQPAASTPPTWSPGEEMVFSVTWAGLKLGESRIATGQPVGHLLPVSLRSHTAGLGSLITFRQQLVSNLDMATGLPDSSQLDALEPGGYRHTDTARFDREAGAATVRERGKFDNTYRIEVPREAVDFVALVFQLRGRPLPDGSRHEFQVLSGRKVSKVVAEVEGREQVKTPAGRFAAVRVRVPTGIDGKFSEKRPTKVWLTDDERRVVVMISADFKIGQGLAELKSYTAGGAGG